MPHFPKTGKGYLLSVEGVDGSGKTTQVKKIVDYLKERDFDVKTFREPGGTAVGESIRTIVKSQKIHPKTELLLYYAARMELMYSQVIPALKNGKVVVLDRFIDSSMAYQGYLCGLKDEVNHLNMLLPVEGDRSILPKLTIYLRIDAETSVLRCKDDTTRVSIDPDIHDNQSIENKSTIIHGYDICQAKSPHRINTIDATKPIEDVWSEIKQILNIKFRQ